MAVGDVRIIVDVEVRNLYPGSIDNVVEKT